MSRRVCCLCDDAKAVLATLADEGLCTWETVDVDRDKTLMVSYGLDVPVLVFENRVLFKHRLVEDELKKSLTELGRQDAVGI
ncbi:glutaredoxin family protein [Mariprofundus micogutta]|nr:glutaredoxin family protein [Mariprofundus micogutta]